MSILHNTITEQDLPESKPHPGRRMTEEEFVAWCEGATWAEWVDGEVVLMPPVNLSHEMIFTFLVRLMGEFVEAHELGIVLTEPFQIRLPGLRRRRSPDIFFVAQNRTEILKPDVLDGAPDLIIEIVSPESQARDWREKYFEYESAGVREYWIIDPNSQHMEAYRLDPERRYQLIEEKDDKIVSGVLNGFYLKPLAWLWQPKQPKVSDVLREMDIPG